MLTRIVLPIIIIRHGVCHLSSQPFIFPSSLLLSLAFSLPLVLSFTSFNSIIRYPFLFVFKPTPQAIYTRKCCNVPVPLIFFVGNNSFVYGILSTQVNMHTLLSRDPKREVDSEISCASRWHSLSFLYDLPKMPLFRASLDFDPPRKSSSRFSLTSTTRTRGPFSVQSNTLIV